MRFWSFKTGSVGLVHTLEIMLMKVSVDTRAIFALLVLLQLMTEVSHWGMTLSWWMLEYSWI
jgi:hypothetical protein